MFLKQPTKFFRLSDVISKGDKAKALPNSLKPGYFFVLDSYLSPTEQNTNYGFVSAKRSNYYFTWRGNDGQPYAMIFNENAFDLNKLKEQGGLSVEDEIALQNDDKKSWLDKFLASLGKDIHTVLWVGVAVISVGYLMNKKK